MFLEISYIRYPKSCVHAHNMIKYPNKNVEECEELCSQNKNCVAFEYGVAYGGGGNYQPRDCQLSDSAAETEGCDGSHHNLDLYVRGNKQRFRHLSSHLMYLLY